ncbi:MAG: GH92 family glycosyl hydrolase, partial [Dyella sp.]
MVTRRRFLQGSAAALTLLGTRLAPASPLAAALSAARQREPAASSLTGGLSRYVDVFIGTGGHGHTYPGATRPFGMVQLSPDTHDQGWDACSGYHQGDGSIMGFSHTHLSGTGASDMLDVLVMPAQGPVRLDPGARGRPEVNYRSQFDGMPPKGVQQPPVDATITPGPGYRSRYDRASEQARPGYYRVHLTDHDILAELTATARTGLHRYTFHGAGAGHLLVDLAHGFHDGDEPAKVSDALLRVVGNDTLVGSRHVHQWANGRQIHFAMKLSRPFTHATLYREDAALDEASEARGDHLKAALHIDDAASAPLLVKVGLSGVDIDGALRNLEAESLGWDFDATRDAALAEWEHELGRIHIDTGSDATRRTFYTALYHTMLAPTLFSDVDGRYRGMDLAVHTLPSGSHNYSTYSLWDTYRALHPLLTLVQPERVPDLVNGLIRMAAESPDGPPVWPLQGVETACMIGYHSASVVA